MATALNVMQKWKDLDLYAEQADRLATALDSSNIGEEKKAIYHAITPCPNLEMYTTAAERDDLVVA